MITIILSAILGWTSLLILFELSHWHVSARFYGPRIGQKIRLVVAWLISLGVLVWWVG